MFGFVFGFACLCGLIHMMRRGRWGYGRRRWSRRWGGEFEGRGGYGRYRMLRGLFERLDTTPGQERVIRKAVGEVVDKARDLRGDLWGASSQVGKAFRSETLDAETLGDILSQHDDALGSMRTTLAGALAQVHEALDPEQRARLSDWMDRRASWRGGPYRAAGF